MKKVEIGHTGLFVPNIAVGCMRIEDKSVAEVQDLIQKSVDAGLNFFDHADIYVRERGGAEKLFGEAFAGLDIKREDIVLQSKVGIYLPGTINDNKRNYFDFSKEHILTSVDESLERLQTEYLDILLLHRNDALWEPEEIAEAFEELAASGKVRHFGVSNHTPLQVDLLKRYVKQDIVANQIQLSPAHTLALDYGFNVNRKNDEGINRAGELIDYARLHDMTVQAWSPIQGENGVFFNDPTYKELNEKLEEIGARYGIDKEAAAIAWILRIPGRTQVVLGTTNIDRILNYAKGSDIQFTREEWYDIYQSAGNLLP
ncbi:aldo/keto reductase family oxidoreductase [Aerococcus sp. 1KP-2016]|uniref:aldo/keto reductase n=1 Tax=Aerococcus sp. 1KP-2016 TaxID=1981982 RepID=UPI000B99CFB9|nr:aldo/keto reductase [Aerococcus sp. 1KP-2016]OYQ65566.1 aldo/keto reductase [Aerococcus sp. 1KP-2016]